MKCKYRKCRRPAAYALSENEPGHGGYPSCRKHLRKALKRLAGEAYVRCLP